MKKTVTLFRLFFGVVFFTTLFWSNLANASHATHIGNLSYVNIAPNVYTLTYKVYFSCGANPGPFPGLITYRAPGCNDSIRSIPVTFQATPSVIVSPYCNVSASSACSNPYAQHTFEEYVFTTIISLPTPCTNWIINASFQNRPWTRNLANIRSTGIFEQVYTEALINNQVTQTNSSPEFLNFPIQFAAVDKSFFYNPGTIESDGDSLVYSLVAPLAHYNVPVVYSNVRDTANVSYPAGFSPAGTYYPGGTFSALNPIIGRNPIALDRLSGSMVIEPLDLADSLAAITYGRNRYLVGMQIDEYRKINGIPVKVGYVRRDLEIVVYSCGPNTLPEVSMFNINGFNYAGNQTVRATVGQPLTITFNSQDADALNIITLRSNAAAALPGATFTSTGGSRPTGTITWTPTASQARSAPYYFTATATDNACPLKGSQMSGLGIRVFGTASPTGTNDNLPTGSFTAYPNPSNSNQVSFKLTNIKADKNAEVLIYNLTGKVVDRIKVKAGDEQIQWNKKAGLPAGVYFARLISVAGSQTIKLVHLK